MIKKINKIKDFGIFQDYSWPSSWLPVFQKHNLLYGWNYSWKTTISRIFRSFEKQQKHTDYPTAIFSLSDEIKNHTQEDLVTLSNVRVFNIDFINENLKWYSDNENQIEPIFILGKENIELQEQLKTIKSELNVLQIEKQQIDDKYSETKTKLENDLTDWANIIKVSMRLLIFTKVHLNQIIDEIKDNPQIHLLEDTKSEQYLNAISSIEQKNSIPVIHSSDLSLQKIFDDVVEIRRRVISSKPILTLVQNPELNAWVDTGRHFHTWENICQFCGWPIGPELFQRLDEHFSIEYEKLKRDISSVLKAITNHHQDTLYKLSVTGIKEKLFIELQDTFETASNDLDSSLVTYIENLVVLEKALYERQENPFVALPDIKEMSDDVKIDSNLKKLNQIIMQHNEKKINFDTDRIEKEGLLKKHFTAQLIIKWKYTERLLQKTELASKSEEWKEKISIKFSDIRIIDAQLSTTAKWAGKINEYIQQFFQHDGLNIQIWSSNRFEIIRDWDLAKNLSEWEKTAISLAYFMTRLEDRDTDLSNSIIFLDDPISSLDGNHLFNTYAFIKAKLTDCKQLFVSTHNLDFFNLMKDFIENILHDETNPRSKVYPPEKLPYYLIQRRKWNDGFYSGIYDMPKSIKKHRTEYIYLFSILENHREISETTDHDMLYILPNIIRRFLEWYSAQRWPGLPWKENFHKMVSCPTNVLKVQSFVDRYSHNQVPETALRFPEINECRDIIQTILDWLKTSDSEHYAALQRYI